MPDYRVSGFASCGASPGREALGELRSPAIDLATSCDDYQQVVRARMGDEVGIDVLEQLCIGLHAPLGFKAYLDPA